MTEAFPLQWPEGWERTPYSQQAWRLQGQPQTWGVVVRRLLDELRRLGAENVVISTNQPLRRDGLPYANTRRIDDPGAAVYFTMKGRQLVMAQDRYLDLVDNLRSIAIAIEHLRGLERHGGGKMLDRAFAGFEALPAPSHWADLGLAPGASAAEIDKAWREGMRTAHPDAGGSTAAAAALNDARARCIDEISL